jgi:hypothetical protein
MHAIYWVSKIQHELIDIDRHQYLRAALNPSTMSADVELAGS